MTAGQAFTILLCSAGPLALAAALAAPARPWRDVAIRAAFAAGAGGLCAAIPPAPTAAPALALAATALALTGAPGGLFRAAPLAALAVLGGWSAPWAPDAQAAPGVALAALAGALPPLVAAKAAAHIAPLRNRGRKLAQTLALTCAAFAAAALLTLAHMAGQGAALLAAGWAIAAMAMTLAAARVRRAPGRLALGTIGLLACIGPLAIPVAATRAGDDVGVRNLAFGFHLYDQQTLDGLLADGRIVWITLQDPLCPACAANAATLIESRALLAAYGVTVMTLEVGDQPQAAAAMLDRFAHASPPLDIAFGPGAPTGHAAPIALRPPALRRMLAITARPSATP